jgi:lipoprotein-anchoring transpeptidase ErfK/SrfK
MRPNTVRARTVAGLVLAVVGLVLAPALAATEDGPPWVDRGDVPLSPGVRSAAPVRNDVALYTEIGRTDLRRGTLMPNARVPVFAARRGANCGGRWLLVGPYAWACSDDLDVGVEEPNRSLHLAPLESGLPYRYFFAGPEGAEAYASFEYAGDEAPERQLEKGFAVPILEERVRGGERYGRTRQGLWIAMRELGAARPLAFQGEELAGTVNVAWIMPERASVFEEPGKKVTGSKMHFQAVHISEERKVGAETYLHVEDGWMKARDLARPSRAEPPVEVTGVSSGERWIDVELATQTLVAYEGTKPVFATLISTGRGAQGTDSATPKGVHRIWAKLNSTAMDNLEKEDAEHYYSIEDVPWVQFFDKAVALHGVFWHRDLGRVKSHGCVNMAPKDAHRLFLFTGPHMPAGWEAVIPTAGDQGNWVRVR